MESQRVLSYFDKILKIPRPSYHEDAIADYLERFGSQRGLSVMRDPYNNVILKKAGNIRSPAVIQQAVAAFTAQRYSEWRDDEPELTIRAETVSAAEQAYEAESSEHICLLLENLPHGPRSQTKEFVCSSVNLALLWETDGELHVELSLRSSFASWYHDEVERIARFARFLGGHAIKKDEYAAWQYQVDSRLLSTTQETYRQLFGKEAICENIHAGVECGIIMEQCSSIREAISFGPTIRSAHTIREELDIDSVGKVYRLLRETLHRLNSLQEEML